MLDQLIGSDRRAKVGSDVDPSASGSKSRRLRQPDLRVGRGEAVAALQGGPQRTWRRKDPNFRDGSSRLLGKPEGRRFSGRAQGDSATEGKAQFAAHSYLTVL